MSGVRRFERNTCLLLFFVLPLVSALIDGGVTRRFIPAEVTTWAELRIKCAAGGFDISLADSFSGSYPGEIVLSARTACVIRGNGKTLDTEGGGRII
jgi:hypothetical protein